MPYGPSETTRSAQKKRSGLVPLLSSVEDIDTAGAHSFPCSFPVGAEPFVAPPLRAPASRRVCPSPFRSAHTHAHALIITKGR
jgi:hypothetical protein